MGKFGALVLSLGLIFGLIASLHSVNVMAADEDALVEQVEYDTFVVKVENMTAHIFNPELQQSHGTGFIVGIDKAADKVTIYTNRHVVDAQPLFAQQLTVHVTAAEGRAEIVPATLVYKSNLHDFAVIQIPYSSLKRTGSRIRVARVPPKGHILGEFIANHKRFQGRTVVAFGNPLGTNNIMSSGEIGGIHPMTHGTRYAAMGSPFIQTTAPINPGNSGGPLVDFESGLVLGMNTMGIDGANNMGFSIPVELLIADHESFLKDPSLAYEKKSTIMFGVIPLSVLRMTGDLDIIHSKFPTFEEFHEHAIRVQDSRNPNLKTGDLLLSINGKQIGSSFYDIKYIAAHSESLEMVIIRDRELLTVTIETPTEHISRIRENLDFVMISGLLLQSINPMAVYASGRDIESNVIVEMVDRHHPAVNFGDTRYPNVGSSVVGIAIEGISYPVKKLFDIKTALSKHPNAKAIRVDVRESVTISDGNGNMGIVQNRYGTNALNGSVSYHWIPISEILTSSNFSINKFRKRFSFVQGRPETRNWRNYIEIGKKPIGTSCDVLLESLKEGA